MRIGIWLVALAGCSGATVQGTNGELTSVGGTAQTITWDGFVYVDPVADDPTIQAVIARQVKSALGALREKSIGISDRGALHNLDPAGWTREPLTVVDPRTGDEQARVVRVRYHYADS